MPNFIPKKTGKEQKPRKRSPRSEKKKWIDKCDKVFSLYIRMRDSKQFHFRYFRCPTCGRILPIDKADNSHYFSRRHMNTRFDEDNCCAECNFDNRFNSEHLVNLGESVKRRIGEQRFALLRVKANTPKNYSVWELMAVYKYYAALIIKMKEEM